MNKIVQLNPEFIRVDSIKAPHCFAYRCAANKIVLRSVDGSTVEVLFHDKERSLNAPLTWSVDGSTLYHAYDQIYAIDVESTSQSAITSFPEKFSVNLHLYHSVASQRLVFYRDTILPSVLSGELEPRSHEDISGVRGWFSLATNGSELCEFPTLSKSPLHDPEYFWWQTTDKVRCLLWKEEVPSEHVIRVWAMDAVGCNRLPLASFPQRPMYKFVLSPDGRTVVYGYHLKQDLALWGAYAGLYLRILPDGVETLVSKRGHHPAWSPLGDKFAYIADSALWVHEPGENKYTKIVAVPGLEVSTPVHFNSDSRQTPAWSWDGRFIAFWLHRPNKGFFERKPGEVLKAEDIEDRHGLVDLERKQVFILNDGYWGHVSWQPSLI